MASELKPWKYDIKYAPEGEANYAWVYDDQGVMVATMKTHKAKQIVDAVNTRPAPAATDTGLVTVAWQRKHPTAGWMDCGEEYIPHYRDHGQEVRELSPRSQAEELLAAKDTEIAYWVKETQRCLKSAQSLSSDNAAKDMLIKDLEAALDVDPSGSDMWRFWSRKAREISEKYAEEVGRREALEAKLSAAEKALEPFADIAGEPWADENGWTDAACQNDRIIDWFGPSAFLAARAALGGKPS